MDVEEQAGATPDALGYRQELKRALGVTDLVVYGLIFISPIAPFSAFGIVFNAAHGMVALVYAIGLVAMSLTAISYMTMSEAFPVAGSVYSYARLGIGEAAGFIAGWAMLLDYLLIPSLAYLACGIALKDAWALPPVWSWLVLFLAINTALNLAGIDNVARANRALLLLQGVLLLLFLIFAIRGVARGTAGAHLALQPFFDAREFSAGLVFGAVSLGVLSFLGFDGISTLAEEARDGRKAVGKATALALALSAGLFILQAYLAGLFVLGRTALPPGQPTYAAFYVIAGVAGGDWLRFATSVLGVVFAGAAGALAAQAATARLLYAMARDRRLPVFLAHVSARQQVPNPALLLVAALTLAIGIAFVSRIEMLVSIVSFGALTGFVLLHASVIVHFAIRQRSRAFVRHLLVPLLGAGVLLSVMANMDWTAKCVGLSWLALGVLLYFVARARGGTER
ncbi:MAG: APC family permease [Alphaproteobacteria bacterium]|nr:APC family permease [Alphaproteobacteria bacterium]